jgi:hypothetical protein
MKMEKPPVILPKEITFLWSRDFMKLRARRYLVMSRIRNKDLNRRVVARIEQESLSIDTGEIVTALRWQAIKRLWKFPDLFLLFTDVYQPTFVTLPVGELAEETKTFIEIKITEHGGRVS